MTAHRLDLLAAVAVTLTLLAFAVGLLWVAAFEIGAVR